MKVDTRFNIQCLVCKTERKTDNTTWVCDKCLEEYQKTHPKEEQESIICEKCGGKTSTRLADDEIYNYCRDCHWTTH